jgi:hypothetical protein
MQMHKRAQSFVHIDRQAAVLAYTKNVLMLEIRIGGWKK